MYAKRFMSILTFALYAVSSLPVYSADPWAGQGNNSASAALLEAASLQLEFGEVEQAGDTLERALRIEPNNPATLHYLGQVRLQQGQYEQAIALAKKSTARARTNTELRNRNFQLIQAARQSMGPGVASGSEAEVAVDEQAEVRVGLYQQRARPGEAGIAAGGLATAEQEGFVTESQAGDWESRYAGGLQAASFDSQPVYDEVRIPRGQMPPRGKCRIWFPDRPVGQQPAPGKCKKLQNQVPQGAYLVRG
ncbi:tetratricopeptide repeat protein [Pseudomonas sp. BN415]|uniref:tetratricopeptide repeat protein n=1 Tax=Pseudomonas sp. BN415 TaxID=2567889 RepID=UPI002455B8E4|nr:tetratricopeptide repeat protein [Pseudomonas sp. BN415]MDH4582097.1 tetratricopeptide repeat protein [Pseudomonas sp. BN415]